MQKNKKRNAGYQGHEAHEPKHVMPSIQAPEMNTVDELSYLLDEELVDKLHSLEQDMQKAFKAGFETTLWEIELAYVKREMMLRRERKAYHEKYLRNLEAEYAMSELDLPYADFDNSTFVELN